MVLPDCKTENLVLMCTGEAGHCFVGEIDYNQLRAPARLRQCVGEITNRCQSSIESE